MSDSTQNTLAIAGLVGASLLFVFLLALMAWIIAFGPFDQMASLASVPVLAFGEDARVELGLLLTRHVARYGDAEPYPSSMFAGLEAGPYVQDNHSLFRYGVQRGAEAAHYLDKDPAEDPAGYRADALSAEVESRQFGGHLPPICNGDPGALARYEYGVVAGVDHRLGSGGRARTEAVA